MARRAFFSFHYQNDVFRAFVVRNSWVGRDREDAGFFDNSVFEATQRTSPDALKRFLNNGLSGCSVVCVLAGRDTARRRWINYEVLQGFRDGRGVLAVAIHSVQCAQRRQADLPGVNPLSVLGFEVREGRVQFKEQGADGVWRWSGDVASCPIGEFPWNLNGRTNAILSELFPCFDWALHNGRENLGAWIERAAQQAGR